MLLFLRVLSTVPSFSFSTIFLDDRAKCTDTNILGIHKFTALPQILLPVLHRYLIFIISKAFFTLQSTLLLLYSLLINPLSLYSREEIPIISSHSPTTSAQTKQPLKPLQIHSVFQILISFTWRMIQCIQNSRLVIFFPLTRNILFYSLFICIVPLEGKSCEEQNILDIFLNGYFPSLTHQKHEGIFL